MAKPNPLSFLRDYLNSDNKKEMIEENDMVIFGDYAWPKTAETNYLVFGTGVNGEPKKYYTLECLLYLLKMLGRIHPAYVRIAKKTNMPVIERKDRDVLLAYLNGEIETTASIDESAPLQLPMLVKRRDDGSVEFVAADEMQDEERVSAGTNTDNRDESDFKDPELKLWQKQYRTQSRSLNCNGEKDDDCPVSAKRSRVEDTKNSSSQE